MIADGFTGDEQPDRAKRLMSFALSLFELAPQFPRSTTGKAVQIAVGIDCGPAILVEIGKDKRLYGNTMDKALRLKYPKKSSKTKTKTKAKAKVKEKTTAKTKTKTKTKLKLNTKTKTKTKIKN